MVIMLLLSSSAFAAIPRYSEDPNDFVSARMEHFWVYGEPFRFTGYNLRGMVHYGRNDILRASETYHVDMNLDYMQSVGARVARVFVSCKFVGMQVTGNRLNYVLQKAAERDIYVIVAFTDLYNTGFCPAGDDTYYNYSSWNLLNEQWFSSAYTINYLPQVLHLVERFKNDPTIFAWQLGNELKTPWNWADLLPFSHAVAQQIRAVNPRQMISHGAAGRSYMGLNWDQAVQLYHDFDFLTVHPYNGTSSFDNDAVLASALGKPLLVAEAGMSSDIYNYIQRPAATDADIAKWIGLGARGYMNWGLMATDKDIGDGDFLYGIDPVIQWKNHHLDFDAYTNVYTYWSGVLANTVPPAPEIPTNLQATDGVWPDRVIVTWDEAFPADDYAVYRADQSSGGSPASTINLLPGSVGYMECGSWDENNRGDRIYDGNLYTKWCCAHNGINTPGDHWLIFDLGSTCAVNSFVVKHASMGGEPTYYNTKSFYIESGPSASGPWTVEFYVDNSTTVAGNTLTYQAPKDLRYIRLRVTKPNPSADWIVRIPEFEVWGTPGSGAPVQISDWQTERVFVDTSVDPGVTYTYWVKARNSGGESMLSPSDDGYASTNPTLTIPEAKSFPNGSTVFVSGGIVTAMLNDVFYIQTADGSAGIRCVGVSPPGPPGRSALFTGTMGTVDGERVLTNAAPVEGSVFIVGSQKPVFMPNRSIGGSAFGLQQGISGASELSNIGLLVRTSGRVTGIGEGYLYIDDGSGLQDGTFTGSEANIGVRVIRDPTGYASGDYLMVTGISSCFETPSGLARRILTRGASDVLVLSSP